MAVSKDLTQGSWKQLYQGQWSIERKNSPLRGQLSTTAGTLAGRSGEYTAEIPEEWELGRSPQERKGW